MTWISTIIPNLYQLSLNLMEMIPLHAVNLYSWLLMIWLFQIEKLFAEKKCVTMRFRSEGCFPLAVFQRLLSAVLSVWPNVNYFAKPLLAANVGAFSLDSFHRLVLALHEETIDVYIYHQTASFHVNPSVLRNIRHFLELNLTRILCVTSSRKHTTKFEHTVADGVISIDTNEKVSQRYL